MNTPIASIAKPNGHTVGQTAADMQATIDRIMAENAALKAKVTQKQTLSLKVSEKGGLSMYGLGRFPVTLYREQWERLLGAAEGVRDFIEANSALLKTKE